MVTLQINKIAPDLSQKIMLGLTVMAWAISFAYYTPEQTQILHMQIGLNNIPPAYDSPSIIPILLFLWIIIGLADATFIHLKVMSDTAMAEGVDTCESCVGGKLHTYGEWGWLRVGGTKAIAIEGDKAWIGLLTHIHRIGTHIVFEGAMTPDTVLDYVPYEIKRDIRQRRKGFWGLISCSVGYVSPNEIENNKEYLTSEYLEYYSEEEKSRLPKTISTSEFLNDLAIKTRTVDMGLQLIENEHDSLSKSLETIKGVGAAVHTQKEKGILQMIFGGG